MTETPNLCKHCGKSPKIVAFPGDLFYAQCRCNKWNPYDFCGATKNGAIRSWNTLNTKKDVQ